MEHRCEDWMEAAVILRLGLHFVNGLKGNEAALLYFYFHGFRTNGGNDLYSLRRIPGNRASSGSALPPSNCQQSMVLVRT